MKATILPFPQVLQAKEGSHKAPYTIEIVTLTTEGESQGEGVVYPGEGLSVLGVLQDMVDSCVTGQEKGILTGVENIISLAISIRRN